MGNLKDLCKEVPASLLRAQAVYNAGQRAKESYEKRMRSLDCEHAIFEQCKRNRTQKRVRNNFSSEEAGVTGMYTRTIRTGKYTTIVCKSRSNY